MVTDMQISLDTNVWIFGLFETNSYCVRILDNLAQFQVVVSNQIRIELTNNLSEPLLDEFYQLVQEAGVELNYERVPEIYITMFESKGLKKGDAIIGGFAEWKEIDKIVRTYAKRQNPPPQSPPKGGKFYSLALWERVRVRVLRKS